MNNLHRELTPISDAALGPDRRGDIAGRSSAILAGRRVVYVHGPLVCGLSAVGTGHLRDIAAPAQGIVARQRE